MRCLRSRKVSKVQIVKKMQNSVEESIGAEPALKKRKLQGNINDIEIGAYEFLIFQLCTLF